MRDIPTDTSRSRHFGSGGDNSSGGNGGGDNSDDGDRFDDYGNLIIPRNYQGS